MKPLHVSGRARSLWSAMRGAFRRRPAAVPRVVSTVQTLRTSRPVVRSGNEVTVRVYGKHLCADALTIEPLSPGYTLAVHPASVSLAGGTRMRLYVVISRDLHSQDERCRFRVSSGDTYAEATVRVPL